MEIETCLWKLRKIIDGSDYRHLEFKIILTTIIVISIIVEYTS